MPTLSYLQGHFKQIGDLITEVGYEVGLTQPSGGLPLASTDPLWQQMVRLSVAVGQDFVRQYDWSMLQTRYSAATPASPPVAATPADFYFVDLPADFLRLIPQTVWNYSTQMPFAGPISPQISCWLTGRIGNSVTLFLGFRLERGDFGIWPNPPPASQTYFFEYMSKNWVQTASTFATASRYTPGFGTLNVFPYYSNTADLVLFDPQLFGRALKLRWLVEKGFDSSAAQADFDSTWDAVVGPDSSAAKLNMNGAGTGFRYLDGTWNVPITGYGNT